MVKILNVGCGNFPIGEINIDIKRNSCVDIICDAENLPFIDNIFNKVIADNVIEHLPNPIKAINEFKRVGNKIIELIVPTFWCEMFCRRKNHIWYFKSAKWFHQFGYVHVMVYRTVLFFPFMWKVEILC